MIFVYKAIVEEWEKVNLSPAFVGLFYLSAFD